MTTENPLIDRIRAAIAERQPLCIQGGGSKSFYGRACQGEALDVSGNTGVTAYEPSELVITARAGTRLDEVEALLAANGQMLPFEPPHFSSLPPRGRAGERERPLLTGAVVSLSPEGGGEATLGGMVATGLSGPRRPWGGSVRDAVLGVKLVNGRGEVLRLGGQVMKNVAGYDLSRLMVGALGTLGVMLEVSIKVLPRPAAERTLVFELDAASAAARQMEWGRKPLPLSATLWHEDRLYVRLSGGNECLRSAQSCLGGEEADPAIWQAVRDHTLPFFASELPLWRVSLPPKAAPLTPSPSPFEGEGSFLTEWNGALRWLASSAAAEDIRRQAALLGGHATLFRGGEPFTPLSPALFALHQRLKAAFDPHGIFNPGRLYEGL